MAQPPRLIHGGGPCAGLGRPPGRSGADARAAESAGGQAALEVSPHLGNAAVLVF